MDSNYHIAISRYLSRKLGISLGDKVRVIMPNASSYTPLGRVPSQRLFTVAALYETQSEIDMSLAFTSGYSLGRVLKLAKSAAPNLSVSLYEPFAVEQVFKRARAQRPVAGTRSACLCETCFFSNSGSSALIFAISGRVALIFRSFGVPKIFLVQAPVLVAFALIASRRAGRTAGP